MRAARPGPHPISSTISTVSSKRSSSTALSSLSLSDSSLSVIEDRSSSRTPSIFEWQPALLRMRSAAKTNANGTKRESLNIIGKAQGRGDALIVFAAEKIQRRDIDEGMKERFARH